jgi:hypothetical protein
MVLIEKMILKNDLFHFIFLFNLLIINFLFDIEYLDFKKTKRFNVKEIFIALNYYYI